MKIIKIGEEYNLVNKEEIKIGDVTLEKDNSENYFMPKIVMPYQLNDNSGIKVIASTDYTFNEMMYKIDKDCIQLMLGETNVKELAESHFGTDIDSIRGSKEYDLEGDRKNGFIAGFNKCLYLNQDKKYTLDDIHNALSYGYHTAKDELKGINSHGYFTRFLKTKLKECYEWEVEIEMRSKSVHELHESNEGFLNNPNLYVPVIENGYINITKIK